MSTGQASAAGGPQSAKPTGGGAVTRKRPPQPRPKPQATVSREAQRLAAVILEVLAGVRTPTEAAAVVSVSVPRYYLWEQRALEGLVRACEPRPQGKGASERYQIARLEKDVARLRQDCARQQALVRASQRTIGLAGATPPPASKSVAKPSGKTPAKVSGTSGGKAKRKRRPVARALVAVAALQAVPKEGENAADSSSANGADVVQRSDPSTSSASADVTCVTDHASMVPAVPET